MLANASKRLDSRESSFATNSKLIGLVIVEESLGLSTTIWTAEKEWTLISGLLCNCNIAAFTCKSL